MEIDLALDQFEQAWKTEYTPDLRRAALVFSQLASTAKLQSQFVHELVMIDFWHRWRRDAQGGLPSHRRNATGAVRSTGGDEPWPLFPRLDDYAKRYSDLLDVSDFPAELIGEEYRARRWFGDNPTHEEYFRRFPRQADQLPMVLARIDAQTSCGHGDKTLTRAEPALECANPEQPGAPSLIGKYHVLAQLDRGGQGRVFRAMHPELRQELAIKLGHPITEYDDSQRDALVAEARVLAQLDHPNLVRVYDLGFHDRCPYVVLDYVPGRNLRDLTREERVTPARAAEIVAKIARAVASVHAHGVMHFDLKPGNILIDQHGEPRLIDFGMARQRSAWTSLDDSSSLVRGTVLYMAPEQARGDSTQLDCRTDVFGLGAVLYDLLVGHPPRRGDTTEELLQLARRGSIDAEALKAPGIPPALASICLKAQAADPQQRHESAASLAVDLEDWQNRKPAFRPSLGAAAAWAALALLALGAVLFAIGSRSAASARTAAEKQAAALVRHLPRHDFPLQFDIVGQPPGQIAKLHDGQAIAVRLLSEVDCYVGVWHVDPAGTTTLLFPNDREQDHFLRAGQPLTIPGRDGYSIEVSSSDAREYLWTAAITHPWDAEVGRARGPAIVLAAPAELQGSETRAATLVQRDGVRVSERVIPLEILPHP